MAIDRPGGVPFCRVRLEGTWNATNLANGEIEERLWWVRSNDEVPQDEHKTEFKRRDRGLIHVIRIPAARDPSQQIKAAISDAARQALERDRVAREPQSRY